MEREQAKNILLFYRDIDGEIKHNSRKIKDYEDQYYIIGGSFSYDGIHKSGNNISSPTEKAALDIPSFVSELIQTLQDKNNELYKLKIAIFTELNKLPLTQKNILNDFYVLRLQWVQISGRVHYSGTQCKKIRNHALENLAKKFAENAVIKNFNYPN